MSQRECLKENGEDHRISLWLQFEKAVNEVLGELCDILVPLFGVGVWVLELSLGNVGDGLHIIITKEGRHARQPGGRTQALAGTYTGHTFMRANIDILRCMVYSRHRNWKWSILCSISGYTMSNWPAVFVSMEEMLVQVQQAK